MLVLKLLDALAFTLEQLSDCGGRCVSDIKPDDLGRETLDVAALAEVRILRDDHVALFTRKLPDFLIRCTAQANLPDVRAARRVTCDSSHQLGAQVLVEE